MAGGFFFYERNLAATLLGCKTSPSTDAAKNRNPSCFHKLTETFLPMAKHNDHVLISLWENNHHLILGDSEFWRQAIFRLFLVENQLSQSFTRTPTWIDKYLVHCHRRGILSQSQPTTPDVYIKIREDMEDETDGQTDCCKCNNYKDTKVWKDTH